MKQYVLLPHPHPATAHCHIWWATSRVCFNHPTISDAYGLHRAPWKTFPTQLDSMICYYRVHFNTNSLYTFLTCSDGMEIPWLMHKSRCTPIYLAIKHSPPTCAYRYTITHPSQYSPSKSISNYRHHFSNEQSNVLFRSKSIQSKLATYPNIRDSICFIVKTF